MPESISVLSFNTGLSRLHFGPFRYNLVARVTERAELIVRALQDVPAEVVCLQEIFDIEHETAIAAELSAAYPHQYFSPKPKLLFGHGLCILSKYPFVLVDEISFSTQGAEKISRKGAVLVKFTEGPLKDVLLANTHFPYGGFGSASQASQSAIFARSQGIRRLHEIMRPETQEVIVTGDFNFGPNVAIQNMKEMYSLQYQLVSDRVITWNPSNPLNKMFPLAKPQSIDHVFVSVPFQIRFRCEQEAVVFNQPVESAEEALFLSDHYGVLVTFGCFS